MLNEMWRQYWAVLHDNSKGAGGAWRHTKMELESESCKSGACVWNKIPDVPVVNE